MKTLKYLLLSLTILFFLNVFSQNYTPRQLKKSSQTFTEINPALIEGTVTDIYTGEGLEGVDVTAGSYSTVSDNLGYYILTVEPGIYDIHYSKYGYENVLIEDTTAVAGETLIIDVEMTLILYPPSWVSAWPNDEDTECIVNWIMPYPYTIELYYDDGTADDYFIWATAGNANAVRFTPAGYPFKVIGGRIYVGDGSFPNGGNIIGSTFGAVIYDDDGVNGLPGTMLDSVGVTVNNYEWIIFSGLDADIYEGDFYLAIFQGEAPPDACPIGIDYTIPTVYRSYSFLVDNNEWEISAYQDFMIRALISPDVKNNDPLVNNEIKTSVEPDSYVVARFSNFDPNGSVFEGDTTIIADSVLGSEYIDQGWAALPMGWYAYGIKTRYILSNGQTLYSDYAPSNIVGHLMRVNVDICVTLSDSSNPAHTVIQLTQLDYPYNNYYEVLDSNNNCVYLQNVWIGYYDLYVYKPGYEPVNIEDFYIQEGVMFVVPLFENRYPPRNLYVDPLTSIATWDAPQITALLEGFNGPLFPPECWTMESEGAGWFKTDSLSFPNFQVPPHNSQFACVIDYQDTVNNNGCCDYLITPQLDLRGSEGFSLKFDSYYTGENGQLAYIEYSLDNCATWVVLYTLSHSYWEYLEIDLSQFSGITGPEAIWFAFHADDDGQQASGWAIDNVEVSVNNNSDWLLLGYYVFLDGDTVAFTEETSYQYQNLTYGLEYEASVAALYNSGLSQRIYYTFESQYLYPPRNLHVDTIDNVLICQPPVYDSIVPENLIGFNLYRDGTYQDYIEWIGGSPNDTITLPGYGFLPPGSYLFSITAVYDLTPYGFPGQTAESMEEGPVIYTISYGYQLPFFEDWASGGFELNEWTTECDNWYINCQTGNPSPSAEFQYDPVLTNYECGLVSYPLLGSDIIDGDIWLDFDIMLDSRFDTAVNEKMIIKVWENGTWHTVAEFINEGDIDWTSNHIDITAIAKEADFRLGFFATGLNSLDIIGWYIDNIHVYRVCRSPLHLVAVIVGFYEYAQLYWYAPYAVYGEWLSYNDGTFENAMASEDGGAGLAQVFTPTHYPCSVTEVRFFVSDYGNYYQDEEVYVLTGDGATILAGPYVVPGVENDWVTVDVDDVTITEGTFMVATFNVLPDGPFIGIDDSYYNAGLYFGTIGDFTELGELLSYYYIGSHEAYVEHEITDNVVVNSVLIKPQSNGIRSDISESNTFFDGTIKLKRDLLGYNIFKGYYGGVFEQINTELVLETTYIDSLPYFGGGCYYVTAVYDQCESDPSNIDCLILPGIEYHITGSTVSVYPNPAKDFINIISTENINKITVINFAGQKVFEKKISDETKILLNTANYETGVYIIKIETEKGITAKRITITR